MDYGLVAAGPEVDRDGNPTHERKLRSFFSRLNVNLPAVSSVGDLIKFVNTDPSVSRPIADIFIGSHANSSGGLSIQMAVGQTPEKNDRKKFLSDYETIEDTMDGTIGSIAIADATIGPNPQTHFVHFKGCNLGKAVPLLQKWKAAFGGKVKLSAPKYNHGLVVDDGNRGLWEYLMYEFVIHNPEPFASRAALIQAFQLEKFRYLETLGPGPVPGPLIPDDNWDKWLPATLDMTAKRDPDTNKPVIDPATKKPELVIANQEKPQWHYFGVEALALPRATVKINEQLTVDESPFVRPVRYANSNDVPTTKAARMVDLRTNLLNDVVNTRLGRLSRFKNTHPFPVYKRWGYDDLDQFLDGFTWRFTHKAGSKLMIARGSRHRYTMLIGVTSPNPGPATTDSELLTNFHPFSSAFLPGNQLPLEDERFFSIV